MVHLHLVRHRAGSAKNLVVDQVAVARRAHARMSAEETMRAHNVYPGIVIDLQYLNQVRLVRIKL